MSPARTGLLCLVIMVGVLGVSFPYLLKQRSRAELEACQTNLKKYAELHQQGVHSTLVCPRSGIPDYQLKTLENRQFLVHCRGMHHQEYGDRHLGFPQYHTQSGLIEPR